MKHISSVLKFTLIILLLVAIRAFASDEKLPEIDGKKIVATVNDEPITLEEFTTALSQIHVSKEGEKPGEKQVSRIDYKGILDRLINSKLIVTEARNIGLDELPEVKEMVDKYSRNTLIGLLKGVYVKGMQVDEEEVEKLYKEAVRELKLKSVLIKKGDDAKKVEEEVKAGKNFDEIVKRVLADGTARGGAQGEYFKGSDLMPQITDAASKMEVGSVSPLIRIPEGYVIFRLEDIRFPANEEAKDKARQEALDYKRKKALEEYKDSLIKKYVKVDEKILDGLDYETSAEEFEKLLKDNRVIAEIEGEQPVTVRELTEAFQKKYFHGVDVAIKGKKKLNDMKRELFYDTLLQRRVFIKEALKQGIDRSAPYKNLISEYENSALFDIFLSKVVIPDIKLTSEELKKYYNKNIHEYSSDEMMKIYGIAFEKRNDAEGVLDRLKKGADFKWLNINAEGQVDKKIQEGILKFDGTLLPTSNLSGDIRKVVSGARPGDSRLYASPEGYFYVLYIEDVSPASAAAFEEVERDIAKKVFDEKLRKSTEDWVDKLKKVYKVKIYSTDFKD